MHSKSHLYSYADENNVVIGGAILFLSNDTLYIERIFISPKYHRIGYGIKLMNDIESMFHFVKEFKLDTPINNIRTNFLYKKLGYNKICTERDCAVYIKNNKK